MGLCHCDGSRSTKNAITTRRCCHHGVVMPSTDHTSPTFHCQKTLLLRTKHLTKSFPVYAVRLGWNKRENGLSCPTKIRAFIGHMSRSSCPRATAKRGLVSMETSIHLPMFSEHLWPPVCCYLLLGRTRMIVTPIEMLVGCLSKHRVRHETRANSGRVQNV